MMAGGNHRHITPMHTLESPYRRLTVNGITLNVLDIGEGPPVLLLHGFPDTHAVWRHQVPALVAAGYRVIAPDTRGCGESELLPRVADYHRDRLVEDLRALLNALQIEQVRLVAHDWGAVQGWLFALAHPGRVERYVALSVGHPGAYASGGLVQKLKGWYTLFFQLPRIPEWLITAGDWWFFRRFTAFPSEFTHWKAALGRPGRLSAGINYYRANIDLFLKRKGWGRVAVPVYAAYSGGDRYLAEGQLRDSARFVDAPFVYRRIEGANHWMQLDAPERVNQLLLEFLQ
jgi:pimeloyl-ACP methyl ester carboxylesterase